MKPIKSRQQTNGQVGEVCLKIGEVSQQTGIGIETLRFYERSGLLDRPERTEGGYRLYDASVLERLRFIRQAQVLGFSLDEIRHLITERKSGNRPCASVREIVQKRLTELDERMAQMRRYRRELATTLAEWDATGDKDGMICGLIEGTSIASAQPIEQKLRGRKK
ncbi:MAG: heavy metal-responsive transcriptional regulator [Acidobacteria bacterium]|nr:heavy metal-responsive transcriptional regulator [Acidobacteriota bacterium]